MLCELDPVDAPILHSFFTEVNEPDLPELPDGDPDI